MVWTRIESIIWSIFTVIVIDIVAYPYSVVEGRGGNQLGASEIPWNPSNKFGWCLLSAGAGGNLHCKRRAPTGPVYGGTEAGLDV